MSVFSKINTYKFSNTDVFSKINTYKFSNTDVFLYFCTNVYQILVKL